MPEREKIESVAAATDARNLDLMGKNYTTSKAFISPTQKNMDVA